MKRIATTAFALCLMSGTAALAQPGQNNNGSHNTGSHNTGSHNTGGQPHYNPQIHNFQGGPQNVQHNNPQVYQHNVQGPQNFQHNAPQIYQHNYQGPQTFQHNYQGPHNYSGPNNFNPQFGAPGFHPGGQRPHYSPQFFPRVFQPGARFHWRGGFWRGPPGWYYHTWYYGQILPWGWFAQDYWISDYWDYDLPVPPYGYEWVRNGPDALLVNIGTGFVAEVVPGIFY